MFRYRDAQGRTQQLPDEAALRAAIADGRVQPTTPMAADDESWTVASRHAAYQRNMTPAPAASSKVRARPTRRQVRWAVAAVLLVALIGWIRFNGARRDYIRMAAAMEWIGHGQPVPLNLLAVAPRGQRAKTLWVVMTASTDAMQRLEAAQRERDIMETPREWLEPSHIMRPSAHERIPRYLQSMISYHNLYADSVGPITEEALRRRAELAGLSDGRLEALIADTRAGADETRRYFQARAAWAEQGLRVHEALLNAERAGGVTIRGTQMTFAGRYSQGAYEAAVRRLAELEDEMNSLEAQMQRSTMEDVARLTGGR